MADKETDRGRKGTYVGIGFIVFGLIGAVFTYYNDLGSFDLIRMMEAKNYAILHAVLWCGAGIGVILWYNRPRDGEPGGELPFETRDTNRDGMA